MIVRFGDTVVATPQALQLAVERSPIGKAIAIEVVRQGKTMTLTYEATAQPNEFSAKFDDDPAADLASEWKDSASKSPRWIAKLPSDWA